MRQKLQRLLDWLDQHPTCPIIIASAYQYDDCPKIQTRIDWMRATYAGRVVRRRIVSETAHYTLVDEGIEILAVEPVDADVSSERL